MITPVRLQLSRRKGFDLQSHSRSVNGLACVNVARPSIYGNPHRWKEAIKEIGFDERQAKQAVVNLFRIEWRGALRDAATPPRTPPMPYGKPMYLGPLRGHNLACWCDLCPSHADKGKPLNVICTACAPCHVDVYADVLLKLANVKESTEQDCPGHVASVLDPKVCGRCGTHIDSLRPDERADYSGGSL